MAPKSAYKTIMKSYHLRIPKYELPIRIRPWFVLFTVVIMLLLAFLGFTDYSHGVPVNDKVQHTFGFFAATVVFFFIVDVEEDVRRIWIWRNTNIILTAFFCIFCGGILSEFVQSLLPEREFQWGDILANLLGSGTGLFLAYHLEKHYRHRREISRLYQPLDDGAMSDGEDDDYATATQLLPLPATANMPSKGASKSNRLADVWDEREDIFDIGDDSDDDGSPRTPRTPRPHPGKVPPVTGP